MNNELVFETWKGDDPRFPIDDNIEGPAPSPDFIDSVCKFQQQAVGMATLNDEWHLVWGGRRLKAIRTGMRRRGEKKHSGDVVVRVFEVDNIAQIHELRLAENLHRANNPVSDALSLRHLMNKYKNYEKVAQVMCMTKHAVKKLEKEWHSVPNWALQAIVDGKMSGTAAKKVGKMKSDVQKNLEQTFKDNGKLTISDVKEVRSVVRDECRTITLPKLNQDKRQKFTRQELSYALSLSDPKMRDYIQNLLKE